MRTAKKMLTYLVIVGIAIVASLNYEIFVFPNRFAPAGLNGLCTMIQYVTGVSVGYMSLLINIPLALLVYRHVSKSLAIRSMIYVVTFSLSLLILDRIDLSAFYYATENGTSTILGPLVAGIIYGGCYSVLIHCHAYSGGTDFIAAMIHKYHPEKETLWMIFSLNVLVALVSFFVYDYQVEPVILCIMYSFMSSTVTDRMSKSLRAAVRFEIITEYPEEISRDIITQLHHTATAVPARGMFLGRQTHIVVCIVNKSQVTALSRIVGKYPQTFAVMGVVNEVMGNFKHLSSDGREEKPILDSGDE